MIKALLAAMLITASTTGYAEAVFVANNAEGTYEWWGYPETFERLTGGYTVIIGKRSIKTNDPEVRGYFGVMLADCKKGFGTLYTRSSPDEDWKSDMLVSTTKPVTVSDVLAAEICNASVKFEENRKPKSAKSTKKSI